MGQLFTKDGVDYGKDGLAPAGQLIFETVRKLTADYPFNMTVTSARDGVHGGGDISGAPDPHYRGEALDFRSKHLSTVQKAKVLMDIRSALYSPAPRRFYAFLEAEGLPNEHVHVQLRNGFANVALSFIADIRASVFPPKTDA